VQDERQVTERVAAEPLAATSKRSLDSATDPPRSRLLV